MWRGVQVCHLFPLPAHHERRIAHASERTRALRRGRGASAVAGPLPSFCNNPFLKDICTYIFDFGNDHLPLEDLDSDRFSTLRSFRGTSWRGKDCNDGDPTVHPGRRPLNWDATYDSNCNGIFGVDPTSGQPWEQILCEDTRCAGSVGVVQSRVR